MVCQEQVPLLAINAQEVAQLALLTPISIKHARHAQILFLHVGFVLLAQVVLFILLLLELVFGVLMLLVVEWQIALPAQ